jgi:hypothetical protein
MCGLQLDGSFIAAIMSSLWLVTTAVVVPDGQRRMDGPSSLASLKESISKNSAGEPTSPRGR